MIEVRIAFLSPWHPGTGRGQGPGADAEASRDARGLPHLPGKTLKGLLREAAVAAASLNLVEANEVTRLFGSSFEAGDGGDVPARHASHPAAMQVYSARMGATAAEAEQWQRWASADQPSDANSQSGQLPASARRHLFRTIASTKLKDGVAADKTLRSIEVVVPMRLTARIVCVDETSAIAVLSAAAPFVNAAGAHRSRGLGRCVVSVVSGGQ